MQSCFQWIRLLRVLPLFLVLASASHAIEDVMAPLPLTQGHVRAIALDAAGNRYVAGFFFGEVDFNPGTGLDAKTSAGGIDGFVTRFNADGSYAWTRIFGGTAADSASAVAVSKTIVYVAGAFSSVDAGVANAGGTDAIVFAVDAAIGVPLASFGNAGVQTFGGTADDEATGIVVSGKAVFVCGAFSSADATIGGAGAFATAGGEDAFVLALDGTDGKRVRDFGHGGVQTLAGLDIEHATALSRSGRTLFVGGYVVPDSTGVGKLGSISGLGGVDAFVLALDRRTGAPRKKFGAGGVQLVGGTLNDLAFGIAAGKGGVYLAGTFSSEDAGVGEVGDARSTGDFDAFVAALNGTTGAAHPFFGISGIQTFGGTDDDAASAIAFVGDRVHVAGGFSSDNAGIGRFGTIATGGGGDGFVLQLDAFTGGAFDFEPATFGGSADDAAFAIAAAGNHFFAAGSSFSPNAGFGGSGLLDAVLWNGFVLDLEASTNDVASRTALDTDGDDFPDEVEVAMGTPPDFFIFSPAGFDAGPAGALTVRSLTIKLNFATPDPALDKIFLRGRVPIPADFSPTGQPVAVAIGGVVRRFVLDSFGVGATSEASFKLTVKRNAAGRVLAQKAKFVATFKSSSIREQLDDEGLAGDATVPAPGEPRTVAAIVVLGGGFFRNDVTLTYTAVAGQSGLAIGP